jgi:hypothetical protein
VTRHGSIPRLEPREFSNAFLAGRTSNEFTNIILDSSGSFAENLEGQINMERTMGMPVMPTSRSLEVVVLELQYSGAKALLYYKPNLLR